MSGQQHSLKQVQHNTVNRSIPTKTKRKTGTHTNTRCNTQKTYTSTHKQNQRMKCMGQLKRIQLPPRRAQFSFYVCVPVCLYLSQIVFMSCTKWTHLPFPPGYQKDTMTFCMYLCIGSDSHSSMQLLLCSFAPSSLSSHAVLLLYLYCHRDQPVWWTKGSKQYTMYRPLWCLVGRSNSWG